LIPYIGILKPPTHPTDLLSKLLSTANTLYTSLRKVNRKERKGIAKSRKVNEKNFPRLFFVIFVFFAVLIYSVYE